MEIRLWIILSLILLGVGVLVAVRKFQHAGHTQDTRTETASNSGMTALPPDVLYEVRRLLDNGQKIAAVKHVREATSWSLKNAKAYVDALARDGDAVVHRPPTAQPVAQVPTETLRQVEALLSQRRKIDAIKALREATNWSLKASKTYVDALASSGGQRPSPAGQAPPKTAGQAPPKTAGQAPIPSLEKAPATLQYEVETMLAQGRKIQAVKRVREVTGWGLKQAKDYVDTLET